MFRGLQNVRNNKTAFVWQPWQPFDQQMLLPIIVKVYSKLPNEPVATIDTSNPEARGEASLRVSKLSFHVSKTQMHPKTTILNFKSLNFVRY